MPSPYERAENRGVFAYLAPGTEPSRVGVVPPAPDVDTWHLGAHPDVVQRLWGQLAAALPADGRRLVADTPALLDAGSGTIVAVALGTQYAIRLTDRGLQEALASGFETVHEFRTVDRVLDLASTFGSGWVFGHYDEREASWLHGGDPERVAGAHRGPGC